MAKGSRNADEAAGRLFERVIRGISPKWAASRTKYRRQEELIHAFASYRHSAISRLQRARGGKSGTADAHLDVIERSNLMERCRDLERNNAIAKGMLDRSVDNVIGVGMTPQSRAGHEDIKGHKKLREAQEDAFKEWAANGADIRGQLSFGHIHRIGYRSRMRDGDVGYILTGGQLQPIEADRICSPHDLDKENIVQGVQMDDVGRPIGYWIANVSSRFGMVNSADCEFVPAKNFIHIYDPERFSQTRGAPAMSSCVGYFEQLDQYIEYELVGAGVAACLSAIITGDEHTDPWAGFAGTEGNAKGEDQRITELEPGAIINLSGTQNGKVTVVDPSKPPKQFPDFVTAILRFLGLPLGLPLELISLDFQKGSYSSARLALLQAYRTFRCQQKIEEMQFCRRVWNWKQREFALKGQVRIPKSVTLPYRHVWQASGWEWIDPEAEIKGHALAMDRGMETLQEIAEQKGMDATDLITARANEIEWATTEAIRVKAVDAAGNPDWRAILRADTRQAGGAGVAEPAGQGE